MIVEDSVSVEKVDCSSIQWHGACSCEQEMGERWLDAVLVRFADASVISSRVVVTSTLAGGNSASFMWGNDFELGWFENVAVLSNFERLRRPSVVASTNLSLTDVSA